MTSDGVLTWAIPPIPTSGAINPQWYNAYKFLLKFTDDGAVGVPNSMTLAQDRRKNNFAVSLALTLPSPGGREVLRPVFPLTLPSPARGRGIEKRALEDEVILRSILVVRLRETSALLSRLLRRRARRRLLRTLV